MVSNLRIQTFSFSLMVFVFLFGQSYHVTEGFQPILKLYFNTTAQGDFLTFESNHPNLEDYSELIPKVQYACGIGRWTAFPAVNYEGYPTFFGFLDSSQAYCKSFDALNAKSIRHWGMSEISNDALSLYEKVMYEGNEIIVEGPVYTGITTPVRSIVGTGNSEWKLFEGKELEGKSVCIKVPNTGYNYYWEYDIQPFLHLNTIGSVFKGCNISEIEEYKRQINLL